MFYRAALPLSSKTLNYAAGIIRRHRRAIGSRWRKLKPGQQALLVLAHLGPGRNDRDRTKHRGMLGGGEARASQAAFPVFSACS